MITAAKQSSQVIILARRHGARRAPISSTSSWMEGWFTSRAESSSLHSNGVEMTTESAIDNAGSMSLSQDHRKAPAPQGGVEAWWARLGDTDNHPNAVSSGSAGPSTAATPPREVRCDPTLDPSTPFLDATLQYWASRGKAPMIAQQGSSMSSTPLDSTASALVEAPQGGVEGWWTRQRSHQPLPAGVGTTTCGGQAESAPLEASSPNAEDVSCIGVEGWWSRHLSLPKDAPLDTSPIRSLELPSSPLPVEGLVMAASSTQGPIPQTRGGSRWRSRGMVEQKKAEQCHR